MKNILKRISHCSVALILVLSLLAGSMITGFAAEEEKEKAPQLTDWSYFSSHGVGDLQADENGGYIIDYLYDGDFFAYSNTTYDVNTQALSATLESVGSYFYLAFSTTDYTDTSPNQSGAGTDVNRVSFLVRKNSDSSATFSQYNPVGEGKESGWKTISDFDWEASHTFDVREYKGAWTFYVDGAGILTTDVLTAFMNENADEKLHFGIGGTSSVTISDITVKDITGWRNWGSATITGNETDGYNLTTGGAFFAVSDTQYDVTKTALSFKITDPKDWSWFSVSKDSATVTELYPSGNGANVSRVSFFIRKASDTTAKITYCCADGSTVEGPSATIDYDWTVAHKYSVREDADGNWYLYVDDNPVTISSSYTHLKEFMEAHTDEKLRFGIGSQYGASFSEVKAVPFTTDDTWSYWSSQGSGVFNGNDQDGYNKTAEHALYAISDKSYDITKKAVSLKLNSHDSAGGDGWAWFSIGTTGTEDTAVTQSGAYNEVNRMMFIIHTSFNGTGNTKFSAWNTAGSGSEAEADYLTIDWTKEHTLGVTQGSDGNWYLTFDNVQLTGAVSTVMNEFIKENGTELRFGIGGQSKFSAENVKIVDLGNITEDGTWSYGFAGQKTISGNPFDGYSTGDFSNNDRPIITDDTYNANDRAFSFKLNSYTGDYFWIGVSTTNWNYLYHTKLDTDSDGTNDRMGWLVRKYDSGITRFSFFTGSETHMYQNNLDWSVAHTFGVTKGVDGHWYLTIDGVQCTGNYSTVLDTFMEANASAIRFGISTPKTMNIEGIKVVEAPEAPEAVEGWSRFHNVVDTSSPAITYALEGNSADGYTVPAVSAGNMVSTNTKYDANNYEVSVKLTSCTDTTNTDWTAFTVSSLGIINTSRVVSGDVDTVNKVTVLIHHNADGNGNTRMAVYNANGSADEYTVFATQNVDWTKTHTLGITKAPNGNWYFTFDGVIYGGSANVLNAFMSRQENNEVYFGLGRNVSMEASGLKVVEKSSVVTVKDENDVAYSLANGSAFTNTLGDYAVNKVELAEGYMATLTNSNGEAFIFGKDFAGITAEDYGTIVSVSASEAEEYTEGDVNGSGAIDIIDLVALKKDIADSSLRSPLASDLNGNGKVNSEDITLVRQLLLTGESKKKLALSASDFGAVGDGVTDDGPAIQAAVAALANGAEGSVLELESDKTYLINTSADSNYAIDLSNASGVTLKGNNTTILVNPEIDHTMRITNSDDVTVEGLSFDLTTRSHFAGTVTEVDTENGYITVKSDRDFGFTDSWNYSSIPFCLVNNEEYTSRNFIRLTKLETVDAEALTYKITAYMADTSLGTAANVEELSIGDVIIVPTPDIGHTDGSAIAISQNEDVTLNNVSVLNAKQFIFSVRGNTGNITFNNVDTVPAEDESVNFCSWRDVYHCKTNSGKLIWNECDARGNGDDIINISANMMYVAAAISENEVICHWPETNRSYGDVKIGSDVVIWNNETGELIAKTTLKKVVDAASNHYILADKIEGLTSGSEIRFCFDSDAAPGSEINNCNFDGTMRLRGEASVNSSKLTIRKMWIEPHERTEGGIPHDISFNNCTFNVVGGAGAFIITANSPIENWSEGYYRLENIVFSSCAGLSKENFSENNFIETSPDYVIFENTVLD